MATLSLNLRIAQIRPVAEGICAFELTAEDLATLPPFTAGSHVSVRVPNGETRKYSLCNDPAERQRYIITVKREAAGRGGSISLIDDARPGDSLPVSVPENAFPLDPAAARYLFIAGGIGITPIISMIRSLGSALHPWQLIYLTHSPERTAYLQELASPAFQGRVRVHHGFGDRAHSFDLWPLLERPSDGHVYCCGPKRLMDDVRDMTGHWPSGRIHFESFTEGGQVSPQDKTFQIHLKRSGRNIEVPVGSTIMSALRQAGLTVASSCESGTCGTCKTRLLAGVPDHRDMVLRPDEQSDQIMICVSRAASSDLTLDL